ncbi:MAG: hypothetical protein R8F63_18705 [Acidimicrobiales bacterium]|nr:hypothetical protein [Acidimicrobiales bacterium]
MSICWSPKGGTGVTITAAALARHRAPRGDTILVDLAGDLAAALGSATDTPGVSDWLAHPDAPPDALRALELEVVAGLRLLPAGAAPGVAFDPERSAMLLDLCDRSADHVVVDAGRLAVESEWWPASAESVVVVRNCYLALRRLSALPERRRTVVLIEEAGRALSRRDVAGVAPGPVVAVPWDPGVARAVDAGLLASRLPRSLRNLERV